MTTLESPSPSPSSAITTPRALLARPWPWVALFAVAFALPVAARLRGEAGASASRVAPPVLWSVPPWELTDQDGRAFGAAALRGRVYVADFVFTRCTTVCPLMTQRMAMLQGRLRAHGDRVHLVSISVDPGHDTPAALRAFAARWRTDPARWTFAAGGDDASVSRLVNQGFRIGLELPARGADGTFDPQAIAHANKFVLVDARGRMRGAYDPDAAGLDALVRDTAAVLAEP
jgi:protein SCO1/2